MGPRTIVNRVLCVALISACSSDPGGGGRTPGTVTGGGGGAGASGGSGGSAGFDNPGTGGGTIIAGTGGTMQMDSGVLPGEEPRQNMVIDECPGTVAMETAQRLQDPALM